MHVHVWLGLAVPGSGTELGWTDGHPLFFWVSLRQECSLDVGEEYQGKLIRHGLIVIARFLSVGHVVHTL